MTDQKSTPKAAPQRRNPSTPAAGMREKTIVTAAVEAGAAWRELCQNEPIAAELFVPRELREALGKLAQVTAS